MEKKTKVTISLLTYNGERYLPWLFKSLHEQTFKDWDLLVIDNASTDNSVSIIREHQPNARIIEQKKNVGFARGHNLLINWSDSEYVFVINQDIILEPDYLDKLVEFLDTNLKAASCAGKLMYWDFNSGAKTKIIDSYGLKIDKKRQVVDAYQGKQDFSLESQEVFGLSAAATLYRRQAIDQVAWQAKDSHLEYFDEDFFAYKEDIDLAWRLRLFGWQNWLITSTKAYHHRSIAKGDDLRQSRRSRGMANKLSYRNHFLTIYKNSFFKNLWRDWIYIKWYEFKKFVYLLFFERSTLVGLNEYLKMIPRMRAKKKYIAKHKKVSAEEIYKWFEK